jgi:hypothetical protein
LRTICKNLEDLIGVSLRVLRQSWLSSEGSIQRLSSEGSIQRR